MLLKLLENPFIRPFLEKGPAESFDERVERIVPVLYMFIIVPLIPIAYLIIRKIYASTIQKPQKRSRMEDLRIAALSHEKLGEYVSAAVIYETEFKDIEKAASLYELGADFTKAARLFENLGQKKKARDLYEKAGEPGPAADLSLALGLLEDAARLYQASGNPLEAAECLERADRKLAAAKAYREAGKYGRASELLDEIGMHKEAAEMFSIVLRGKDLSFATLDEFFTYAELLERADDEMGSQELFRRIAALDPNYREVGEKIKAHVMEEKARAVTEIEGQPSPDATPVAADEPLEFPRRAEENSLRALIRKRGRLEPKESLKIWVQALKGVKEYQHANGAHGALSPECILVENGVARIKKERKNSDYTEEGPLDPGSDIYSMGLILYEMLTGERTGVSLKNLQSVYADFPLWLYGVLQKCLKPRGEGRFGSIDEIFAALKSASQKK